MYRFRIERYKCKIDMVINNQLFLKGDEIYIQNYDPVAGRSQQVFNSKRERIGALDKDDYWDLQKELELVKS